MKSLLLILALAFPIIVSATTVSGEAQISTSRTIATPLTQSGNTLSGTTIPQKKTPPTITYSIGVKGGCYTLVKNQKTGKTLKKYVNKQLCKKTTKK